MENLFFLVVLLIVIIANVINLKKRTKRGPSGGIAAENPASSGYSGALGSLKTSVEQFLEQIKGEFGTSSDGLSDRVRRSPGDEDLVPGQPEPARRKQGLPKQAETRQDKRSPGLPKGRENIRDPFMERRAEKTPPLIARPGAAKNDIEKQIKDRLDTNKRDVLDVKPAADLSVFRKGVYSVSQLQRAVVWSEVLGPPVALRKDDVQ